MLSREEVSVLLSALAAWRGPYTGNLNLTETDLCQRRRELAIADALIKNFATVQRLWYDIERNTEVSS